ncbi:hypothetical protein SAMN05216270_11565 [Glycomyces harbinensis]|uniref:Uncharacterized protein n=1 Tax=Glycomyces harbinensis TaxID=58114 RepID=A0A1G7B307_9ACTN|nr:hypothetical protein SAMN05216270_11565 [Glycomyces harbinensis]
MTAALPRGLSADLNPFGGQGLLYVCRRVSVPDMEVVMVVGIAVAVGVVLVGLCGYHVVRKWRRARG